MRTGSDYVGSLRDGRAVMLDGEQVDDVTKHPAFSGVVRTMAMMHDVAADPADRDVYTYPSPRDGSPVHTWWMIPRDRDDLAARRRAITAWSELSCGFLGRSPDHVASFLAGFAGSLPLFAEGGQMFADNVERFYEHARDESLYLSYTIIHPTVDRTKPPHQQYAPNLYVSVLREADDGIVLQGAQMLGTGSVMSDYILVSCILPLPEGSEDYALSVVVPNNAAGLRIYSRRSYADGTSSTHDHPLSNRFDETDSLVVFDEVFVPWEHVFAYRNIAVTSGQFQRTAAHSLGNTQAQIRFATKLRYFAGLAHRILDGAGVSGDPKNRMRLGQLAGRCMLPEAYVHAAESRCTIDQYGVANPHHATLYSAMSMQPGLMNEVIFSLRELTGGSVIQLPSSRASFGDPLSAEHTDRYIRWPEVSADERVRLLNLAWDSIGSEFAGRHMQYEMFYAGDPSVVQMRSFNTYQWDEATRLVDDCLAGVAGHDDTGM
ncbi:MAG TPA: 4-hydroxyphenylacetate 3-hydroxylase N-terminal domain-containing protein [Ilumatobacteraceae bacterium]|nr:4-hydroxyphenylacetate 3-hydroxylase N-terminal domain-containing protein [Ilumatobacteraceae bacterium]